MDEWNFHVHELKYIPKRLITRFNIDMQESPKVGKERRVFERGQTKERERIGGFEPNILTNILDHLFQSMLYFAWPNNSAVKMLC